jgi:hypothetical protein
MPFAIVVPTGPHEEWEHFAFVVYGFVDIRCEMHHVAVSSLEHPDGVVQVPDPAPDFNAVLEAEGIAGDRVPEHLLSGVWRKLWPLPGSARWC